MRAASFIGALALSGCVQSLGGCVQLPTGPDLTAAMAQLKNDPATVCFSIQSPYGTVTAVRIGQTGTTAKGCSDISQGMQSSPLVVAVPMAPGQQAQILQPRN